MPNYITTPNMNLLEPIPGVETGPQYAVDINSSLTLIDQHDHSPGHGVQINPSGINIDNDLPLNNNNLTLVRSIRFDSQNAPIDLVTDLSCLYTVNQTGSNGDLWFNDASGNEIQITKTGAVLATISALVSGSNEASFVANQLVVNSVESNGTPANVVMASVLLGNNTTGTNFLTLQPPNAMPASYNVTLPAPNAISQTAILTYDTSNNILASTPLAPLISGSTPSGAVVMYGGTAAPTNWLLCDGNSYLRSDFPTLFSIVGTAYGSIDATHFNVPDMRGMFPRGVTGTTGNDPDASSRTANNVGGNTGNNVGSQQADQFLSHIHENSTITAGSGIIGYSTGGLAGTNPTQATGGNETRPINVYFNFIIKT